MNETKTRAALPPSPADESPLPPPRATVLLIDDQPARLLSYEAILSGLGVHCVRALSGQQALAALLREEFAVIILDIQMPEMDGFEVARLIRGHPRYEHTPIIFVTGVHVSELDQLKSYQAGAIDYLQIPLVPEVLRSKVAVLVELYHRRRELKVINQALQDARAQLVADRSRVEARSEAHFDRLFEHPTDLVAILRAHRDASGAIVDWVLLKANENSLRFLRAGHETPIGASLSQVLPKRAAKVAALAARVLKTREPISYEDQIGDRFFLITMFLFDEDRVISSAKDITEHRRMQEALRDADRRKDEFLAMLSHELRNPVAPIRSAAEVLARITNHDERQAALVGIILRQTQQFSRLLDDLLDVARITQGRISLQLEIISVSSCVELAVEMAEPEMRDGRHGLTVSHHPHPLYVHGDRARLVLCVANLLKNAAKYTPPGGDIRVQIRADSGMAVVQVSDNGRGISAELLPHVFELFVQGEQSADRTGAGLGIGLSVCQRLIEMHGGTVEAHSPGPGLGATFTIKVPLREASLNASAHSAPPAPSGMRILIVDDNGDAADTLAMLLQLEGHTTRAVYSAESAIEGAVNFSPDVVLLDIGLPRMDGYEVARRIRTSLPNARLIALTGYGQAQDRKRSAAAGFDAHLVKPIDRTHLDRILTDGE